MYLIIITKSFYYEFLLYSDEWGILKKRLNSDIQGDIEYKSYLIKFMKELCT